MPDVSDDFEKDTADESTMHCLLLVAGRKITIASALTEHFHDGMGQPQNQQLFVPCSWLGAVLIVITHAFSDMEIPGEYFSTIHGITKSRN